ncbi:hypothetical protein EDEG_03020 [Edhazardia aedis USNM 41457]|uniref:Uncharacterized protein n=1 Tax=Edhazardia aedis (strain USNM 41457) TaxID=1003232 RepID=J9DJ05_EDHAE|nr:hypothetical protein EDEG_03020 [Edhazardia aedis USNM 41457]|eukprot:EJW02565.1 hypothetical protein EDEG_03020 [Edhazardia aedis USNM 41457]
MRIKKLSDDIKKYENLIRSNFAEIARLKQHISSFEHHMYTNQIIESDIRVLQNEKIRLLSSDRENHFNNHGKIKEQIIQEINRQIEAKKTEIAAKNKKYNEILTIISDYEKINNLHKNRIAILTMEKDRLQVYALKN